MRAERKQLTLHEAARRARAPLTPGPGLQASAHVVDEVFEFFFGADLPACHAERRPSWGMQRSVVHRRDVVSPHPTLAARASGTVRRGPRSGWRRWRPRC